MGELHITESTINGYQLLPLLEVDEQKTTRRTTDTALIKHITVSGRVLEVFYWAGLFTKNLLVSVV